MTQPAAAPPEPTDSAPSTEVLGLFGRYLSLWVAVAIVVGIALGQWFPTVPDKLSEF
jgi:ACR3 family arsenite transporter